MPPWIQRCYGLYLDRMQINESFRGLERLLHFGKPMNTSRESLENSIASVLIAHSIGL